MRSGCKLHITNYSEVNATDHIPFSYFPSHSGSFFWLKLVYIYYNKPLSLLLSFSFSSNNQLIDC